MTVLKSSVNTVGDTLPNPVTTKRAVGDRHSLTTGDTVTGEYVVKNISGTLTFVLAAAPAVPGASHTASFGLPATTGRTAGDLHHNKSNGRLYSLVDNSGLLEWTLSANQDTVGAGLPALTGRLPGDKHYDSAALAPYVMTGAPGTTRYDDFNRANGAVGTPSDGGAAWVTETNGPVIVSNQVERSTSGADLLLDLGAGLHEVSWDIVAPSTPNSWATLKFAADSAGSTYLFIRPQNSGSTTVFTCTYGTDAVANAWATTGNGTGVTIIAGDIVTFTAKMTSTSTCDLSMTNRRTGQVQSRTGVAMGAARTGTWVGASIPQTGAPIDNFTGQNSGTLAWLREVPAALPVGTVSGTVAAGDDSRIVSAATAAVSTVGDGLPSVSNRKAGDLHYDTSYTPDKPFIYTGAPGSQPAADSFDRADSASTLGSTSVGSLAWSTGGSNANTSTWGITSNRAYRAAAGTTGSGGATWHEAIVRPGGSRDVEVGAKVYFTATTQTPGLVLRKHTTSGDHFIVHIASGNASQLQWREWVNSGAVGNSGSINLTTPFLTGDRLSVKVVGTTATVYVNGLLVGSFSIQGPYLDVANSTGFGLVNSNTSVPTFDDFTINTIGTGAWVAHAPDTAAAISLLDSANIYTATNVEDALAEVSLRASKSTVGFGLPTTVGRAAGDLHFDRVGRRTYTLVVAGGVSTWELTSGSNSTVGSGLAVFAGRVQGDRHYDSTAQKDYVLTGVPGTSVYDDFNRANGNSASTSSGASYVAGMGNATVTGNKIVASTGIVELSTVDQTASMAFTMNTSAATDGTLYLRVAPAFASYYDFHFYGNGDGFVHISIGRTGSNFGGANNLATTVPFTAGGTYTCGASVVGDVLTITVNNWSMSLTDPGAALTGTRAGFTVPVNGGSIDDFAAFSNGSLTWALVGGALAGF